MGIRSPVLRNGRDILRLVCGEVQVFEEDQLILAWPDLDTRSHSQALVEKLE